MSEEEYEVRQDVMDEIVAEDELDEEDSGGGAGMPTSTMTELFGSEGSEDDEEEMT